MCRQWRRPGVEFGRDGKIIFRGSKFLFPIFTPQNSDDLFLLIDQVFLIFTLFFQIIRILLSKMSYMTLSSQQKHYFRKNSFTTPIFLSSVHAFPPFRQHYFSKYWGEGTMHGPSLHLKFFWGG